MGTSRHASSGRPQARKRLRMDEQGQGWRGHDEDTWDDAAREQTSVRRRPRRLTFPPQRARYRDAYDDEPYESFEPDRPYDAYDDAYDDEYNARDEDGGNFGVVEVEDEYDTGRRRVRRQMTGPQTAVHSNPRLSRLPRRASASEPLETVGRRRENSSARPLASELSPEQSRALAQIERASQARLPVPAPAVVPAHLAPHARLHRPHLDTRALARSAANSAKSPWSVTRTLLAIIAVTAAIWTSLAAAGEPSQPLMSWQPGAGTHDARAITRLVQPETQGTRPDLYDSTDQFNAWWDAACSAAVMSEVLTAWGKQGASIGRMIDVMQPDISLNGGLLTPQGFQRGAQAFGYRADVSWKLTYKQLLYITNTLGLPVIVNVRISYGYYHFFAGGHFLVMTGGDDQGLTIVDSSEYYIRYLPLDTFASMFTGMTAIVVPQDYTYHVP